MREGKRVFVPCLDLQALCGGVCSVGQKQDEEGSAQLEVGEAGSGLIQGTTNVAEGSNTVGFAVISSLAEQERLAAQERSYFVQWIKR